MKAIPSVMGNLKAVIFDVDGTLYSQAALRRKILWRFVRVHLTRPFEAIRNARVIAVYRRAQEKLRTREPNWTDIGAAQLRLACEESGTPEEIVRACIRRWMEEEPLDLLASCLRDGVHEFLSSARASGMRLAAYSDYPARRKLAALGVEQLLDIVVAAEDPSVQRFKPDPRGLEVALERLKVSPREAVYVGDRTDVDAPAAANAGVACVILEGHSSDPQGGWIAVSGFKELQRVILGNRGSDAREDQRSQG